MRFADANRGWAVGYEGTIVATTDGSTNWKQQNSGTKQNLYSAHFVDTNHGWAVGSRGTIVATTDGGASWKPQNSNTQQALFSVHFVDTDHGWAVGVGGTIVATTDGGTSWKPQNSGTQQNLYAVYLTDVNHGSITGRAGTILITGTGGVSWKAPEPPNRYPAPWYYFAAVLCLVVAAPALRSEVVVPPADSAANRQVSDNPIGPKDLDALGLSDIALGLSQFFRNVDTRPPLTVGILGEWGQGKSSVMRLLEADLRKNGVYPVWFNAWHYQKEDHLLAYLLEAIRKQAVPKLQTLQGLRFRARLLGFRAARARWTAAGLVILVAFCIGLLQHPEVITRLGELAKDISKWREAAGKITIYGLSAGAALLALRQIYDALKTFHVNPAALIKEAAGSASIKDLGEKTNIRMAFAQEFGDATRALEPYRMVIFIDDLDRCNPASVTQILESVNFLTSGGDCFVVMGLAKKQVEASVGLSFKEVAEELGDTADPKKMRREYAQQYLRKLINLEVKVPTATPEQQRVLLAGRVEADKPNTKTYAERLGDFAKANRPVAWVAITLVMAGVSLWYGRNFKFDEQPRPPVATTTIQPPSAPNNEDGGRRVVTEDKNRANSEKSSPTVFVPGIPEAHRLTWLPVIPALVLLGFGAWALTRRPNEIIQDSRKFTEALEIWQPVIGRQHSTPREIKRFLNRVRYIAMRWRKPSQQKTGLERLADWVQGKVQRKSATEIRDAVTEIDEAGIVRMAALEGIRGEIPTPGSDVVIAGMKHTEQFGESSLDWKRFREITGEVDVN